MEMFKACLLLVLMIDVHWGDTTFVSLLSFEQEIGDVENWARSIEMDMRTTATALEYVHKGQLQSASS